MRSSMWDNPTLTRRFTLLVVLTLSLASVIYILWSFTTQNTVAENTALVEARTMTQQMDASWSYISDSQDTINQDADGRYEFKGIYCATAGKQIADEFTRNSSGYVIRYVRDNPRNPIDKPDEFESQALQSFRSDGATEYYNIEEYNGERVFRYASALRIGNNCLACHGDPAGSKDPTGSYREGMAFGDLAGASSIIIPLGAYESSAQQRALLTIAFFGALLFVMVFVVQLALRRWVLKPMEEANKRLERDNKAKNDFLTLVSHELRTPLSSIVAFTDIWQRSSEPRKPEEEYLVDEIRDNSDVLLGMVNNIIDTAKVDSGKYKLMKEQVDIFDVVNTVKSITEPIAIKKDVSLAVTLSSETPIIVSDWEALRKILTNLVGNAIKFTDSGGSVGLVVRYDEDARQIVIAVSDTGCGIAPDDIERIFERFEQSGQGNASRENGSGLGLYLSRNLASMLGGHLDVESVVGEGSAFTLTVPVAMEDDEEDDLHEPR